jgi:DNA polymerase-1
MLLQVHDELVFEVKATETEAFIQHVKSIMENVVQLSVPLIVDAGIGANWDEAH